MDSQESSPTPQFKTSILQGSAFFIVQLSHPYMTTGKIIALTRLTFVGKVMSLLFHMLSRLVITFLPRSKRFSISWLQAPSAMILAAKKIKSVIVSNYSSFQSQKFKLNRKIWWKRHNTRAESLAVICSTVLKLGEEFKLPKNKWSLS